MEDWHDLACRSLDYFDNGSISGCQSCGSIQLQPETAQFEDHYTLQHDDDKNRLCKSGGNGDDSGIDENTVFQDSKTVYRHLEGTNDIRLLELCPGEFDDPIRCSLFLSNAYGVVEYDAISYTWGGEDNNMEQTSRIHMGSREILVTPNCEAVLRRVRRRTPRVIWIDAICINQEDIRERGHQVKLMQQIYSRAEHVLIYIGEPTSEEEDLLRLLMTEQSESDIDPQPLMHETLGKLLSRSYFSRVWVLQEVALARRATLICGDFAWPWALFLQTALPSRGSLTSKASTQIPPNLDRLPSVLSFSKPAYRDSDMLLDLVDLARHNHATDPRDKIFGVFGLLSGAESDGLTPDYAQSTVEVYMRFAEWIGRRHGTTAVLRRALGAQTTLFDRTSLPSWAPNWTEKASITVGTALGFEATRPDSSVRVDVEARTIRFRAYKLGSFRQEWSIACRNQQETLGPWLYMSIGTLDSRMVSGDRMVFSFPQERVTTAITEAAEAVTETTQIAAQAARNAVAGAETPHYHPNIRPYGASFMAETWTEISTVRARILTGRRASRPRLPPPTTATELEGIVAEAEAIIAEAEAANSEAKAAAEAAVNPAKYKAALKSYAREWIKNAAQHAAAAYFRVAEAAYIEAWSADANAKWMVAGAHAATARAATTAAAKIVEAVAKLAEAEELDASASKYLGLTELPAASRQEPQQHEISSVRIYVPQHAIESSQPISQTSVRPDYSSGRATISESSRMQRRSFRHAGRFSNVGVCGYERSDGKVVITGLLRFERPWFKVDPTDCQYIEVASAW